MAVILEGLHPDHHNPEARCFRRPQISRQRSKGARKMLRQVTSIFALTLFCDRVSAFQKMTISRIKIPGASSKCLFWCDPYQIMYQKRSALKIQNGPGEDSNQPDNVKPFDKGASEFVPLDMQPANEWVLLKKEFLFDWPLLPNEVNSQSKVSKHTPLI